MKSRRFELNWTVESWKHQCIDKAAAWNDNPDVPSTKRCSTSIIYETMLMDHDLWSLFMRPWRWINSSTMKQLVWKTSKKVSGKSSRRWNSESRSATNPYRPDPLCLVRLYYDMLHLWWKHLRLFSRIEGCDRKHSHLPHMCRLDLLYVIRPVRLVYSLMLRLRITGDFYLIDLGPVPLFQHVNLSLPAFVGGATFLKF